MSDDLPPANLALDACLVTVAENILAADQALALLRAIGTNSEAINAAGWGHPFFALQAALADQFVVCTARVFEPPKRQYPIHSLRAAASSLQAAPGAFCLVDRHYVLRYLGPSGAPGGADPPTPEEITALVATAVLNALPDLDREGPEEHDRILNALKARRDKVIAHSEAIDKVALPSWTWPEGIKLLELAKRLTGVLSRGYTRVIYTDDDGEFLLASGALRTGRSLERFLSKALKPPTGEPGTA